MLSFCVCCYPKQCGTHAAGGEGRVGSARRTKERAETCLFETQGSPQSSFFFLHHLSTVSALSRAHEHPAQDHEAARGLVRVGRGDHGSASSATAYLQVGRSPGEWLYLCI